MVASDANRKMRLSLTFEAPEQESAYRDFLIERNLNNCRVGWGLMLVLCILFTAFDSLAFADNSSQVLILRIGLISVATLAIGLSFFTRSRIFFPLHSVVFIVAVGSFCLGLMLLVNDSYFAVYFTGIFFAFAGGFINPGISNTLNLFAMIAIWVTFLLLLSLVKQADGPTLLLYGGFLAAILPVFGYAGYLVESNIRHNYLVSERLRVSLSEVRTLTGLLPICSSCKKIRDDRGYWSQIESYLHTHIDVDFTHGYCPDCEEEMIAELNRPKRG